MISRDELKRFAAFNAVGLATMVVGVPVMGLLDLIGMPYEGYTAVNYGVGIFLGFWWNLRFAFRNHQSPVRPTLFRYLVCFVALLAVVQTLQFGVIEAAGWPRWWGVGLGMILYGSVGYFVSRFWVFRPETVRQIRRFRQARSSPSSTGNRLRRS